MEIKLNGKITGIEAADLDDIEASETLIIEAAIDLSEDLTKRLHEVKLNRLVRFCQTGRFE